MICSNGLVIRETVAELRDIHNKHLTLDPIVKVVNEGLQKVAGDLKRLQTWEKTPVPSDRLTFWVDEDVAGAWGPKAASRVLHICCTGRLSSARGSETPGEPTNV